MIFLKEQAAAGTDKTNYGQIWTKNSVPNELWFTNESGTDGVIGQGYETGTWTPTFVDVVNWVEVGSTWTHRIGNYAITGHYCIAWFDVAVATKNTSAVADININWLPFFINPAMTFSVHISYWDSITVGAYHSIGGYAYNGNYPQIALYDLDDTGLTTRLLGTAFAANSRVIGYVEYFTDRNQGWWASNY